MAATSEATGAERTAATGEELPLVKLGEDGPARLEAAFASGRPARFDVSAHLPEAIARLDLETLGREHPDATARPLAGPFFGTTGRLAHLCEWMLARAEDAGSEEAGSEVPGGGVAGTAVLSAVDPELARLAKANPLLAAWAERSAVLWLGGSLPALHYDGFDNLLVQITGRKRYILYDVAHTRRFAPELRARARPQAEGRPEGEGAASVPFYTGWLNPGEALAIPCGGLHALSGTQDCVSLNCFVRGGPPPADPGLARRYFFGETLPRAVCRRVPRPVRAALGRFRLDGPLWRLARIAARERERVAYPIDFSRA